MSINYTDRIFPNNKGLTTYLDELIAKNYQIPTFQRDIVWSQENVKKLWDSIYKFYPLGSILIWKTNVKLSNHRTIGGREITDINFTRAEYQYILDGQQRTTSLLTSLYGRKIEKLSNFDPTLYVDLTIPIKNETDDESYKNRFLFWSEIDDRNGEIRQNRGKKKKFNEGLIVKLIDIKNNYTDIQKRVFNSDIVNNDFNHPILSELSKIKGVLDNYRISFIEIKGIKVPEVCQIFERINQAGKPLNIFDIVVAKTFKPENTEKNDNGFYLRELIDNFREYNNSEFLKIGDLDYLQILATIIKENIKDSGVKNITDTYLNEIKTEYILEVWEETKKAILKTFDFFENHLHIKTPYLIPFRYFYFTITAYFYKNNSPNYNFLKKYFWFYSFHNDDLLSNTTYLNQHIAFLNRDKIKESIIFERFLIDKQTIRTATYSSKGRISRAILALYSNAQSKDWEHCDREVLAHNLFFSTDKPNLHHIFPTNSEYVLKNQYNNKITNDSLMNIAYLTQITNLNITNKNPIEYLKDYDKPQFEKILSSHLLSNEILEWARLGVLPDNALDQFIENRVNLVLETLKIKLEGINFEIIDTKRVGGFELTNN
ncbi:GmrSD restriction endonuclease domain-containing protein [Suttonella ornithocola]|uniref:Uncharacterized conserved protein n=1 Tax=Suttonella ornithocola TaxID=279832 RepID=A0A380MRR4_9GAMM|nr:DUF262 domain-containing protein [Suttonella ornithocola]SUO94854.1 Uncharacterized conserved protein [Suttonella ornithocola]